MGVSVETGRRRGLLVELNLVPFIDFMSCLIAFLMCAAVWTQIASLDVTQAVGDGNGELAPPPLTVHVSADGLFACRKVEEGVTLPRTADGYDLSGLRALFAKDHALFPTEDLIVIDTDDGVPYEAMVAVLDLSRESGYQRTMLGGGPPVATPVLPG
jgi:biopolymer transport protein ExbD